MASGPMAVASAKGNVLADAVVGVPRGHRGEVEAVEIGEEAVEVLGVGGHGGNGSGSLMRHARRQGMIV